MVGESSAARGGPECRRPVWGDAMGLSRVWLRVGMSGLCLALLAAATTAAMATDGRRDTELASALASPAAERREWALDRLIQTPDPDPMILQQIAGLLDDRDGYVAGKAANALGRLGADAFTTIDGLLEHGSAQQRWAATVALYQTTAGIERFLPQLIRNLAQSDERLVYASLAVLTRLQSRAAPALPALQKLLTHEHGEVRRSTLATLAAIGPAARGLVPDLAPLLQDPQPELRLAAAAAMQRIVPSAPIANERLAAYLAWLQEHVPALMQEHHVPGVSIAVIQDRRVRWAQGFGVRDARGQQPVTTDTIFEACSMSKAILALSALQLIQQERLDLDTPLTQYLGHDYLRNQPEQGLITARMALTHRTGLPNWRMGYDEMDGPLPLLFFPGSEYTYSGEGILFLQRAMEAIAGMTLDRYAQQGLFAPLGLTHTSYVWTPAIEQDLASGHRDDGSFKERTRYRKANGAYSLYTTPSEYAQLMLTLMRPQSLGDEAFTPASVELLLQRAQRVTDGTAVVRPGLARSVATYTALGWSLEVSAEGDIVQHSGANSSGFRSFGQFNRDRGSGLVIFANGVNGSRVREAIVAQIGDL
jgi:CubicO group peptidase (beta-lactamase class C family)